MAEYNVSTHRLSFIKVAETSEIPVGKMKTVIVNDKEVLITNVNGSFFAIANPCTHKGGALSEGSLEGKIVTCPIHGSRFDVTTGKNLVGPKSLFLKGKTDDAKSYEVRVEGKDILVYHKSPWGI